MAHTKKERKEYNERRQRVAEKMGLDKNAYNALRRVGHKLTEADTNYANGRRNYPHGEAYGEKEHGKDVGEAFKKAEKLRKKKKLGIHFYHQSDPRGASLYVSKERMKDTDYHSKGTNIY